MTDAILAGAVLTATAALGIHDARRALVDPRTVLALLGAAAAWRFLGNGADDAGAWARLANGVLGAALGVAAVMVPIAVAQLLRRRWPLYPGDAMMLGAFGFLLGVPGLAWTMLLGSGFALAHRFWLQRRRGRPFRKGLVPLGPGMCAGAAVVFLCIDCGVALAGDGARAEREGAPRNAAAVETLPLAAATAGGEVRLPATELGPALGALPAGLAAREVSVEATRELPFAALVRRLASVSGVAMTIEERAARIVGGDAVLADPPPLRLSWQGPLGGLLDRVAASSGYDWSWRDGVVFYRYWDVDQRGPAGPAAGAAESRPGALEESKAGGRWTADPARHGTLRGVLEEWAARAGWTLVWNAERDYALGAAASFGGKFLEAADLLLSGPATRRALDARAYRANRHLVVGDAGGAGW